MATSRALTRSKATKKKTVGQTWKYRRNLVIYLTSKHGATQRLLADVFDLPHSRIADIIQELRLESEGELPKS